MLIRIGRLLKAHGVRGMAKCGYTTDVPENIPKRTSYILFDPITNELLGVELLRAELKGDYFLARFDAFDSPETVRLYSGWDIMCISDSESNREAGDYFYYELAGLEVRTAEGKVLGTVNNIFDSGAHVLLEVENLKGLLLPFTEMYIPEVNLEQGYLICTYPIGESAELK